MTRDALIKLAVECHWRWGDGEYLERGLAAINPGDDPNLDTWREGHIIEETVFLWDARESFPAKLVGTCLLSDLRSHRHPWIIGPFSGKFFSLKTQRFFPTEPK